ncbi:MAG: hypothetical protein N3F08_01390 [Crenarchaeota archaeon]|nr:hypothetical protein [Thermoproteota archaeon]
MGRHFYEIPLEGDQKYYLKEKLFRLLGYDALREFETRISKDVSEDERVVLLVHFDNGKVAYCGNEQFEVHIRQGAKSITSMEIVAFKEITGLKRLALRVLENPIDTNVKGLLGEKIIDEKFMDQILDEVSRKSGIPKEEMVIKHRGEKMKGEGGPDFVLKRKGTNEIVTVLEVKYVSDPKDIGDFEDRLNEAARQVKGYLADPEWASPYGVTVVIAWPPEQILNDEPCPPIVGIYKNPCIEFFSREGG